MEPTDENVIDISKNLTLEQIVARGFRQLTPEMQDQVRSLSERTGISLNALLLQALDIGLEIAEAELRKDLNTLPPTPGGAA